ncbi:MAG: DUF1624 domain-containing protein [Clostridia bacterium]|nr:DUF1624 domain-containing protein [Clostridia bacterium]
MTAQNALPSKRRVVILDTLRGIAIIYMVFFHLLYDLSEIFYLAWAQPIYDSQLSVVVFDTASFVLLAGITVRFSRNPAAHGARILCIAALFTAVTALIFPGFGIYFGVLHLIGISMLLYSVTGKYLDKMPWWAGALIFALLFAFTYNVKLGYFGIEGIFTLDVPKAYLTGSLMYPFGFVDARFASVDYLPLMPWSFLFLAGACVGRLFGRTLPEFCYKSLCPPLEWLGRHSLAIYIIHQPVIFVLVYAIVNIFG